MSDWGRWPIHRAEDKATESCTLRVPEWIAAGETNTALDVQAPTCYRPRMEGTMQRTAEFEEHL
jgi:hypothetical protein